MAVNITARLNSCNISFQPPAASFQLLIVKCLSAERRAPSADDYFIARCSAIGPSTATGMNIRSPRMITTAHSVNP